MWTETAFRKQKWPSNCSPREWKRWGFELATLLLIGQKNFSATVSSLSSGGQWRRKQRQKQRMFWGERTSTTRLPFGWIWMSSRSCDSRWELEIETFGAFWFFRWSTWSTHHRLRAASSFVAQLQLRPVNDVWASLARIKCSKYSPTTQEGSCVRSPMAYPTHPFGSSNHDVNREGKVYGAQRTQLRRQHLDILTHNGPFDSLTHHMLCNPRISLPSFFSCLSTSSCENWPLCCVIVTVVYVLK